ncbi:L-arabinose transport system permease protein AraQ [Candidatus Izimaplasma bacterium HR1]|jgi:raffinose/stachyose/melibiose transport system permease protein|uniref:carbohydrate ABC transporter permease n=1 Tax=Candidatus Izimoplasma sp. HR1 TaxID=1541959 RepID=UPI0004F78DAD|nr:L-arabinose transport system permease protein AraQ [Candidatus Izimaplasma bacterium HR1]
MKYLKSISFYIVIIIIVVVSFTPLFVLIKLAVADPGLSMYETITNFTDFRFANFIDAWQASNLGRSILNSSIITLGSIATCITVSAMAGYAIARFTTWYNKLFFRALLFTMMIPAIINAVPLYVIMSKIHGLNSYWAIILLLSANTLPFSVFVYTSFIKSIPVEVEEAAIIDGCTRFQAFWKVTFHFLKPATASVVIIQGVGIWNNYAQVVFYLTKNNMQTIPLSINSFFHKYGADWNSMAAASLISIVPTIVIFILFQKYFVKGIQAGALKG